MRPPSSSPFAIKLFGVDPSVIRKNTLLENESLTVKGVLSPHPPLSEPTFPTPRLYHWQRAFALHFEREPRLFGKDATRPSYEYSSRVPNK